MRVGTSGAWKVLSKAAKHSEHWNVPFACLGHKKENRVKDEQRTITFIGQKTVQKAKVWDALKHVRNVKTLSGDRAFGFYFVAVVLRVRSEQEEQQVAGRLGVDNTIRETSSHCFYLL